MPVGRPKASRQLAHCREEGLSCQECLRNSATSLARIGSGLNAGSSRQLFFAMYPEPGCQQQVGTFLQYMRQESEGLAKKPALFLPVLEAAVA